jgi:hypothetical protein
VSVWRHQDEAIGVSGPEGVIANPSRPLSGCVGPGGSKKTAVARVSSAGGASSHVDPYGLMLPGRQVVLERITQAGSPHSLMEKVRLAITWPCLPAYQFCCAKLKVGSGLVLSWVLHCLGSTAAVVAVTRLLDRSPASGTASGGRRKDSRARGSCNA